MTTPPNWGQQYSAPQPPPKKKSWFSRHKILTGALAFFGVIILIVVISSSGKSSTTTDADSTSGSGGTSAEHPAKGKSKKAIASKPTQEEQFISIIEKARDSADDADNAFRRRLALTNRNASICKLLKSKNIKNWTGEVKTLDTNGDGLGVLSIKIADNIKVGTWNNALSDLEDNTLIKKDSPVFEAMASFNEGDQVTFTGKLVTDSEECIGEQSLTDNGSTKTPEFTIRFSKVTKD